MHRRDLLKACAAGALAAALPGGAWAAAPARKPNFIVVLCDDLGYGDTSVYGPSAIRTPHLERMAREGVVLTDYYAPANLCTPSRAGLLTGRYPVRTGLGYEVIMQQDDRGLPLSEVTIGKALKPDYATALIGKWHLGHQGAAWPPTKHGFDRFFGIPYSHDMLPLSLFESTAGSDEIKQSPVDFPQLQQRFYEQAARFIDDNKDRPFFLELALSAPHLPSYPHDPFDQKTAAGPYGAVVAEIDSIMGRLLDKLKALHLDRDTLVIFTSDNGPWFEGSAGNLRDRKGGGGYDGGSRVPFIAWRPGTLPAGKRTSAIASGVDLLPTFCAMAGVAPPKDVVLDGLDITGVLKGGKASPHEDLVIFNNEVPVAIRSQRWKYIAGDYYRGAFLPYALFGYEELYDLQADPGENYSVAKNFPEVTKIMRERLKAARETFAPFKHAEPPPVFKALRSQLDRLQD